MFVRYIFPRLQYENLLRLPSEVPPRHLHCLRCHALIEALPEDQERKEKGTRPSVKDY